MNQLLLLALLATSTLTFGRTFPLTRIPSPGLDDQNRRMTYASPRSSPFPLGGGVASLGEFYATIQLGTPPQTLNVQVDTGSSDLLVFGRLCTDCDSNITYGAIYSSSYTAVPCDEQGYTCPTCANFLSHYACSFSDYYGDGSGVNGSVLTDLMNVGEFKQINVSFGYIMSSSQDFEHNPVDGIWGISYPDLGITTPALDSLISQTDSYNGFSLCLPPPGFSSNPSSMTIGKPEDTSQFSFTKIVRKQYYNVEVNDMTVNGVSLGLPPNVYSSPFAIVDSGTTLLILPQKAMNSLFASFTKLCSQGTNLEGVCGQSYGNSIFNGSCIEMTSSNVKAFPTLAITLNGISPLSIMPSQYLIPMTQNGITYSCFGIASSGTEGTILGDVFMGGFNTFFDIENSQVGFAPVSTCPSI